MREKCNRLPNPICTQTQRQQARKGTLSWQKKGIMAFQKSGPKGGLCELPPKIDTCFLLRNYTCNSDETWPQPP